MANFREFLEKNTIFHEHPVRLGQTNVTEELATEEMVLWGRVNLEIIIVYL